jgi:hypothetical protein
MPPSRLSSDASCKEGIMSKISLGNFDHIEIYETPPIPKVRWIQLALGLGIALLLVVAIAAAVEGHDHITELYQMDATPFLGP